MQIRHIAFTLIALGFSSSVWSQSQHGGHTGGSSSSSRDSGCIKAKVSNFQPANMETIAPGGGFQLSFLAVMDLAIFMSPSETNQLLSTY